MGVTAVALYLSVSGGRVGWLVGQVLLALALVQWFVLLHECGHETLFRSKWIHVYVGHLAAFFSGIPFHCWKRIHAKHHKWTGWQDLDPTTETLVPRELGRFEKMLANFCWSYWIPLFAVIYRVNNFWNVPRLIGIFREKKRRRQLLWNIAILGASYVVLLWVVGVGQFVRVAGVGILLSLMFQEWIILSQHTHIPMRLSRGQKVAPYPAIEQEPFTRSLEFPRWFSSSFLLNMDAHELHHMYPFVPAYHLRRVEQPTQNVFGWWRWILAAKRVPGEVFLFHNRDETGLNL
jgi:fatty acid desaturase